MASIVLENLLGTVVIDDLIDRVMVDPRLNANPQVDEAHHRVSAQGFKLPCTVRRVVEP